MVSSSLLPRHPYITDPLQMTPRALTAPTLPTLLTPLSTTPQVLLPVPLVQVASLANTTALV